jgi:succinate dehydrogenase / fumarate reductase membrane anchor subunit
MSLRSPLGHARGMGSAKEGHGHWWQVKLTALALIPLSIWFIASVIGLAGAHYEHFLAWLSVPGNTALMLLLLFCVFHHAQLGLQVVIEDYLHDGAAKVAALILVKMTSWLLGVFSAVSVLRAALVGG